MPSDPVRRTTIEETAYRRSVLQESSGLVSALRQALGAGMVARLAGVTETRAVHEWADGRRSIRSHAVEARLRLAFQALTMVSLAFSDDVAARWFEQACPALAYRTPENALVNFPAEDNGPALLLAASDFVDHLEAA
jgi:hypothetical protein